jgi:hypothetical protein
MLQYPTDKQQEAIEALGMALDAPGEADRAFFERHPERATSYAVSTGSSCACMRSWMAAGRRSRRGSSSTTRSSGSSGDVRSSCFRRHRFITPSGSRMRRAEWCGSRLEQQQIMQRDEGCAECRAR